MAMILTYILVLAIVLPCTASVVTCIRLLIRTRLGRFWWDDAFIVAALVGMQFEMAGTVTLSYDRTSGLPRMTKVAAYYMYAQLPQCHSATL